MEETMTDHMINKTTAPKEGKLTKEIEHVTARLPSGGYLGIALGSMALSAGIAAFSKRKSLANFVGLWVPTILVMGVYNKIVKLEGSDRDDKNSSFSSYH